MAYETNTIKERLTDTFGFTMVEKVEAECGPDCDYEEELTRPGPKSAAQTPAPPKERIKGSKENPEGTAATRSKTGDIEISEANEQALKDKIAEFKKDHPQKNAPSLGTLKKVFRRGAGAFSTSFRPTITGGKPNSRNAWAMARVNKFLKMAGGGEVKESYRKADGDLLEERLEDCGTGAGGFKEGNTCAEGGGKEGDENNGETRQSIESMLKIKDFEDSVRRNDFESALIVDNNGNELVKKKGTSTGVDFSKEERDLMKKSKNVILTHNHPRDLPLSKSDYVFAAQNNLAEVRAVGPRTTYVLKRPKSGWPNAGLIGSEYDTAMYGVYNKTKNSSVFPDSKMLSTSINEELNKKFNFKYEVYEARN